MFNAAVSMLSVAYSSNLQITVTYLPVSGATAYILGVLLGPR